jgi:MoaA/NifB/PqqE/SkfB family radical SAM enzyme
VSAVIERVSYLGIEKISYSGGEPTIWPGIESAVTTAAKASILQVLTTNGDSFADSIPSWLSHLEYLKLSFYGGRDSHDAFMGSGNYDALLRLARRVGDLTGLHVGANYMLTDQSIVEAKVFLAEAHAAGIGDVMFQTYIYTGSRRVDQRFALSNNDDAIAMLDLVCGSSGVKFDKGIKVQNYALKDWFIVLDEKDQFTLPASDGMKDFVMGHLDDEVLRLPNGDERPSPEALEAVWNLRLRSPAIVEIA